MWRRALTLVRVWLRRREVEQELDEELRFHLEMQALENERRGMEAGDARRAAADTFGGYERVKELCRDARGGRVLETLAQDVRFAARTLRANAGYSAAAILTLGLGIGANAAVFSAVNGVLIRPLPYADDERLVEVVQRSVATQEEIGFSPLEVADYRAGTASFSGLVEYHSMSFNLLGGSEPQRVQTGVVSAAFFDVMGLKPLLGRTFRAADDAHGAAPVLVLGHPFWQRAFHGDRTIVGRQVEMNDRRHTVVGVMPPAPLAYPQADEVYMPIESCPFRSAAHWRDDRAARGLSMLARLADGVTTRAALADVEALRARLRTAHPGAYASRGTVLPGTVLPGTVLPGTVSPDPASPDTALEMLPLRDQLTREARPTFLLLLVTAAFVLLIACANVANLMLAALIRRDRELALRTALGAGRARLVRQLLTESTLLALVGGAFGLALAWLGLDLLVAFAARFTPRAPEIAIDGAVLAFTFALSLVTGLVFGTLPALVRPNLVVALKEGGGRATVGPAGWSVRNALIVGQLAISFVLLIAAGLTVRSLMRLQGVDPGFDAENVITARLDLNWSKYTDDRTILRFSGDLVARVRALPGVTHAAVANTFPLGGMRFTSNAFQIRGREKRRGGFQPVAEVRHASVGYFAAVGIRLVRGRLYREDASGSEAVINESLAHRYWGSGDPIGQQASADGGRTWATIVGVVSDVRHNGLDRAAADEAYVSWAADPWRDFRLVVRRDADATALAGSIRAIVKAIDAEQPVTEIQTLVDYRRESLASPRLTALLLGTFAALALGIAATGLAGVVAFSVGQRTREFGIRMVLGADPARVLRGVVGEGLAVVAAGLALGAAVALVATKLLAGLLFEIEARDPITFAGVFLVLLAVGVVACLIPARRATDVQPIAALRAS